MFPSAVLAGSEPETPVLEPIAICGMSCRLPGGVDSDSTFWNMLVEKRTGQTPKVPASRFNIDAHYHENLDRPGSFNVPGGYFLDGRPEDFDPTFFNITPIEAQWLDPQQRKILEVTYECLVSAGVTLESIAGSNTAVFVGSFTADYQQISIRDPDFRHNYAATGVDPGIISNRVGNVFNLNGPSFTINTACSSSIYALHNACHALRSRDCDAAIVGGVNLILTVDQHMNTAKLGILSPTSTCHTFDASADGYGRAEGAGALYVKRLADAIRDGDPIRGVVRSTAVNTNGKVEGMGITHPSIRGQERVVRMAYEKADLDPNLTAYAELHGTGTPVGDPIEVNAISRAMNDTRPPDKPLLIGAVKPCIGHSEAASGIFAVMKAALMTEEAIIPGVALLKNLNPAILENEWNVKVQADTVPWPKDSLVRRASVSSFGYGGTNGHVIIESIDSLYPWYQHAKSKKEAEYNRSSTKPFLLCFSAHDKPTLSRNITAIAAVASEYYLTDLSYTLNLHRTKFAHRAFTVVREGSEVEAFAPTTVKSGISSKKNIGIGFLFTGQGAQWAGMGRIALQEFPTVLDTLQKLDRILSKLDPKPEFNMVDLLIDDTPATASKIAEAEISQPLCTAIQIAIVDLFSEWDITPQVSIGHSSGEIGAAYAAGLLSAPEAIIAAFCRGRAVAAHSGQGAMLAVGLGLNEVQEFLPSNPEDICVACENSPSSVTLSGRAEPISQLYETLSAKGILVRALPTGKAYHSPHMATVGDAYDVMLTEAVGSLSQEDLEWCRPRSQMISSVSGEPIAEGVNTLPASYWTANLRQRVLFDTAVKRLGSDEDFALINYVIEVGPHSALAGPFKQICRANKNMTGRLTYVPSLVRKKDDADQLLSVAGSLFVAGYPVDLEAVNSGGYPAKSAIRKSNTQYLLVDLPPYQWNYERRYWAEPRASAEQRARTYPRHDLLGSRISGLSKRSAAWRNILRQRDIPWLKDHNLGGTAIFPAAGYLSVAIEALRQVRESAGLPFEGVTLRDVDIKTALMVPDNDDGVEIVVHLQESTTIEAAYGWHTFSVESLTDNGEWIVHCDGRVSVISKPTTYETPVDESILTQRVSGKRWYDAFHRVGFYYGKTFQQLQQVRTDRSVSHAAANVTVRENSGVMKGESRYLVHPSTIDACLQLIIVSIHAGKHKEMPWGVVPTRIEDISIFAAGLDSHAETDSATGHAVAWTDGFDGRRFNTNGRLSGADDRLLLDIKNLTCIAYDAALPADSTESPEEPDNLGPFSVVNWKPDIENLDEKQFAKLWPAIVTPSERLAKCVELIHHRQAVRTVLIISHDPTHSVQEPIDVMIDTLPHRVAITIGIVTETGEQEQELTLSERAQDRVSVITLGGKPESWSHENAGSYDLVLTDSRCTEVISSSALLTLVDEGGWLLGSSATPLSPFTLQMGQEFALLNSPSKTVANGVSPLESGTDKITILSAREGGDWYNIQSTLSGIGERYKICQKSINNFHAEDDRLVVMDDTMGAMSASMLGDSTSFGAVKAILTSGVRVLWVTSGARQGCAAAATAVRMGMAEGLLRVVRSEQAASKIVLLDFDLNEEPDNVGTAIISRLKAVDTKDSGHDTEFWLHGGVLHTSRVYAERSVDHGPSQGQTKEKTLGGILRLNRTANSQLIFEDGGPLSLALADNDVELQVSTSQWPFISRGSQLLVGGIITRAGSSENQRLVGKSAIALMYDEFQTVVQTSAYAVINETEPEWASPEVLMGILPSLGPMVQLCLFNANLKECDYVMSLPGPSSDVSTLVRLSRVLNWNISVVAHSALERERYISQDGLSPERVLLSGDISYLLAYARKQKEKSSSGTMTIIAHEFDSLSQELWRNIPESCRFLLSNQSSLESVPLDPLPFSRGASFVASNMKSLRGSPRAISEFLKLSLDLLKTHSSMLVDHGSSGIKVVDIQDARDITTAPSGEQNEKTTVVRYRQGQSQIKVVEKSQQLQFSSDASYLLVGCLGGLGRSLTRWMMERGARHFAFISRSGADRPEAARLIESINASGASTKVFRADATDEEAVRQIVAVLHAQRPIRGVVHGAMVLKDGMFEQMSHQSFADCINPKARGALNLHTELQSLNVDLDFFVLTSSISALLGNTGQANYSSANSALDALARQRHAAGLPATALVLPMVLDVGVVAENDAIETSLLRKGLYGIDEYEMLQGFEAAMIAPRRGPCKDFPATTDSRAQTTEVEDRSQIVMGMEARELARSLILASEGEQSVDAYWYDDVRFCHVRAALEEIIADKGGRRNTGESSFAATIKEAMAEGVEHAIEVIAKHVAKRVSSILMIPSEDFELDGPSVASYGLDSMIGAEMRTWLFKEFGLDYPFQKLLAPTLTFTKLAGVIAETMGLFPETV
ncbi:hypothetical protein F4818DRAFT_454399 [Hypoxylon cercidicola]|nr:hypothetical protein F4818DRAFT_454399 [Hypoxylon cercidicola]